MKWFQCAIVSTMRAANGALIPVKTNWTIIDKTGGMRKPAAGLPAIKVSGIYGDWYRVTSTFVTPQGAILNKSVYVSAPYQKVYNIVF